MEWDLPDARKKGKVLKNMNRIMICFTLFLRT
jgi:hypothetical protein